MAGHGAKRILAAETGTSRSTGRVAVPVVVGSFTDHFMKPGFEWFSSPLETSSGKNSFSDIRGQAI